MAQLESSGIPAIRDSHDATGIFGPWFSGSTSRGVTVSVPTRFIDQARAVVTLVDGTVSYEASSVKSSRKN